MRVTPITMYKTKFSQSSYEVFNIKNNKNGYPTFLIYERNQWIWIKAKYFKPVEEWGCSLFYDFNEKDKMDYQQALDFFQRRNKRRFLFAWLQGLSECFGCYKSYWKADTEETYSKMFSRQVSFAYCKNRKYLLSYLP